MRLLLLSFIAICFGMGLSTKKVEPQKTTRLLSIIRLESASQRFICSGTVISEKHVLTAAHCVVTHGPFGLGSEYAEGMSITDIDGKVRKPVHVLGANERADYAILEGDFSEFAPAPILTEPGALQQAYKNSHHIASCGYPYAGKLWCTEWKYQGPMFFQMIGDAQIYPGMSGGPVIDLDTGLIIGVNTAMQGQQALLSPLVNLYEDLQIAP